MGGRRVDDVPSGRWLRTGASMVGVLVSLGALGATCMPASPSTPAPSLAADDPQAASAVVADAGLPDAVEPPPLVSTPAVPPVVASPPPKLLSARAPRRVLIVGASSVAGALGRAFIDQLAGYEGVEVLRFGKPSSSLSRPEFFDWPAKLIELITQFQPDLVIANFGGNCAQTLGGGPDNNIGFRDPRWPEAYGRRVDKIIEIVEASGADLLLVGMPNPENDGYRWQMRIVNGVQETTAQAAGSTWWSTWPFTSNADGSVRVTVQDAWKREARMRLDDGIHLGTAGASYVVQHLLPRLERKWRLVPRSPDLATATPWTLRVDGDDHEVFAFVPRGQGPWPALEIVATSRWRDDELPHRELQRFAQKRSVALFVTRAPLPEPGWSALAAQHPLGDRRARFALDAPAASADPGPGGVVAGDASSGAVARAVARALAAVDLGSLLDKEVGHLLAPVPTPSTLAIGRMRMPANDVGWRALP